MTRKYSVVKEDRKNIKRYVSFKIIERVVVYNKGVFFNEYTRFEGSELFVIYEDGNITLTNDENEASVFFETDNPQGVYLNIIDKLKNKEIHGEGIQVIEYNELHGHSSEVLHYPNHYYSDLIQPISIYKGYSIELEKAREQRSQILHYEAYDNLVDYINCRGWELSAEDWDYINISPTARLERLLLTNRGRNNFIILDKRR